jgi:hypothetical protein
MKKRSLHDIIDRALGAQTRVEIGTNGVWLPVPDNVYEKLKELLAMKQIERGTNDWTLTVLLYEKDSDKAIVLTHLPAKDLDEG